MSIRCRFIWQIDYAFLSTCGRDVGARDATSHNSAHGSDCVVLVSPLLWRYLEDCLCRSPFGLFTLVEAAGRPCQQRWPSPGTLPPLGPFWRPLQISTCIRHSLASRSERLAQMQLRYLLSIRSQAAFFPSFWSNTSLLDFSFTLRTFQPTSSSLFLTIEVLITLGQRVPHRLCSSCYRRGLSWNDVRYNPFQPQPHGAQNAPTYQVDLCLYHEHDEGEEEACRARRGKAVVK